MHHLLCQKTSHAFCKADIVDELYFKDYSHFQNEMKLLLDSHVKALYVPSFDFFIIITLTTLSNFSLSLSVPILPWEMHKAKFNVYEGNFFNSIYNTVITIQQGAIKTH